MSDQDKKTTEQTSTETPSVKDKKTTDSKQESKTVEPVTQQKPEPAKEKEKPVETKSTQAKIPDPTSSKDKKAKPEKQKKGGGFATFLSLVALAGVGGASAYGWMELSKLKGAVNERVQEQKALIKESDPSKKFDTFKQNFASRFDTVLTEQNNLKQAIEKTQNNVSQIQNAVSQNVAENTKDQRDWVISEAEYLMHIANYRLRLLRDVNTATEALKSANNRIGELNDPGFIEVREALANEISKLQELGSFDGSGITLKILSVSKLVSELPPAVLSSNKSEQPEQATQENQQEQTQSKHPMLANFARWVGIKHKNRPYKAMPSQQDVFYVDQVLRLELDAARHAALRLDETAYSHHITTATSLIKEHYDEKSEPVKFVLTELRSLKARDVFPALPDISESSVLLNKAKNMYHPNNKGE